MYRQRIGSEKKAKDSMQPTLRTLRLRTDKASGAKKQRQKARKDSTQSHGEKCVGTRLIAFAVSAFATTERQAGVGKPQGSRCSDLISYRIHSIHCENEECVMRQWAILSSVLGLTGAGVLAAVLQFAPQPAQNIPDVLQIGRGTVEHIEWQPNSDVLLVTTIRGAWLYTETMQDIAHIEEARLARFSPDGAVLAGVDAENNVRLWDGHTFAPQATLYRHNTPIIDLAWSPRGTQVATLDADGLITVYTLTAENPLTLHHLPGAFFIKWSPNGTYLASMGQSGTFVWSATGELIFQNPFTSGSYTWQNDEQLQVWYLGDGSAGKAWNVTTGYEIEVFIGSDVTFSPDHKWVVSTWYSEKVLYESLQNRQRHIIQDTLIELNTSAMVWHATQSYLAIAASNGDDTSQIQVYENRSLWMADATGKWHFPYRWISQLAWREDRMLALVADGKVLVWDYANDKILGEGYAHGLIGSKVGYWTESMDLMWSPEGRYIITPDSSNNLQLWDAATGEQTATLTGSKQAISHVLSQPNGNLIAARSDTRYSYNVYQRPENGIFIWDTSQAKGILEPTYELSFGSPPVGMAWSASGDELAIATVNTVYFWDAEQKSVTRHFLPLEQATCGTGELSGLIWKPDFPHIIATTENCGPSAIFHWNVFTGEPASIPLPPPKARTTNWSIKDTHLWSCASCPHARRLHLTQSVLDANGVTQAIREITLGAMAAEIMSGEVSPSQTAVYARDLFHTVAVWGLPDGQLRFTLPDVQRVRWTDDGQALFVIDKQGQIYLVDAQTGARTVFPHIGLEARLFTYNNHPNANLHLSPDNARLAYIDKGVITIVNAQAE
jgi:WD40 repeat protein